MSPRLEELERKVDVLIVSLLAAMVLLAVGVELGRKSERSRAEARAAMYGGAPMPGAPNQSEEP